MEEIQNPLSQNTELQPDLSSLQQQEMLTKRDDRGVKTLIYKSLVFVFALSLVILFFYILFSPSLSLEDYNSLEGVGGFMFTLSLLIFVETLFLYYVFEKEWLAEAIFISFIIVLPFSIYVKLQELNQIEQASLVTIFGSLKPELVPYSVYIALVASLFFELFIRLLGKKVAFLRVKLEESPYTIRLYFLMIIITLAGIIEIFT